GVGRHPGGAPSSGCGGRPSAGGMVTGALTDDDRVAHPVSHVGDTSLAIAPKQADTGAAGTANQAVVTGRSRVAPGSVKTFDPAVASHVVGECHRGDGVGKATVIDGEGPH